MNDLHDYLDYLGERIDGTTEQIARIPESKRGTQRAIVLSEMLAEFNGAYVQLAYYISSREKALQVPQSTAAASASATPHRSAKSA